MSNVVKIRFQTSNAPEDNELARENRASMLKALDDIRTAVENDEVVDLVIGAVGITPDEDSMYFSFGVHNNPAAGIGMLEGMKIHLALGE